MISSIFRHNLSVNSWPLIKCRSQNQAVSSSLWVITFAGPYQRFSKSNRMRCLMIWLAPNYLRCSSGFLPCLKMNQIFAACFRGTKYKAIWSESHPAKKLNWSRMCAWSPHGPRQSFKQLFNADLVATIIIFLKYNEGSISFAVADSPTWTVSLIMRAALLWMQGYFTYSLICSTEHQVSFLCLPFCSWSLVWVYTGCRLQLKLHFQVSFSLGIFYQRSFI